MFLDEILVQQEMERTQRDTGQRYEDIKADILRKEREQKKVQEYRSELEAGTVVINGKAHNCEKREVLDGKAAAYIFPEDVEKLFEEDPVASVQYRTLEMSSTVSFLQMAVVVKDEAEYQQKLKEQLDESNIPYNPVDCGNLQSGTTKIYYVSGITYNAAGGLYIINYYYFKKSGFVSGSFTCTLLQRYTFENLFLAMLHLICEEDNQDVT